MDGDRRDPADQRATQWILVESRGSLPNDDRPTTDIIAVGSAIRASRIIVQVGDDDGYEEYLATHWLPPGDPD